MSVAELRPRPMQFLKVVCGLICLVILVSNIWTISHWNESRGVYDDVCYLRQAHLFQRFGLSGLNTDITRDDDHYLASKLKAIGFPTWNEPATAPCHSLMPKTQRRVMQYPPGTGLVLALFPAGFQMIPLYGLANLIIFCFALLGLAYARSTSSILLTTAYNCLALYLMINPTKASYSMAPTMVVCAVAGFFTARFLLAAQGRDRMLLAALLGLLIGLSVNFRLPNLFLAAGYFLFFTGSFWSCRKAGTILQAVAFGVACLAGMAPTLVANAINAGSPFATTYAGVDVTPPDFSLHVIRQYLADMQFVLLVLAGAWTIFALRRQNPAALKAAAQVTAGNLVVNLGFFMSHPVFTPYYTVPVAMLSLWSLLFATLMRPVAMEQDFAVRAAGARS